MWSAQLESPLQPPTKLNDMDLRNLRKGGGAK